MDEYQMMTPMKVVVMDGWILWGLYVGTRKRVGFRLFCF